MVLNSVLRHIYGSPQEEDRSPFQFPLYPWLVAFVKPPQPSARAFC